MEIVRRGSGELVYAELRVVKADWEGETMELVSLRDITVRKRVEEQTLQLVEERDALPKFSDADPSALSMYAALLPRRPPSAPRSWLASLRRSSSLRACTLRRLAALLWLRMSGRPSLRISTPSALRNGLARVFLRLLACAAAAA